MFLAVALGAFGTHALGSKLTEHYLNVYKTAVQYQLIHALALFAVAWLTTQSGDLRVQYAGVLFITGIVFFCGSLYLLSVTEIRWLGALTPIGGLAFLAGWALLFTAKYKQFY